MKMKDKRISYIGLILISFIIQINLGFRIFSAAPDLMLVTLIFICVRMDAVFGLYAGFFTGLLYYFSAGFGFGALVLAGSAAGFLASNPGKMLSRKSSITALVSVVWITLVTNCILYLFSPRDFCAFLLLTGVQLVLNTAAALLILFVLFLFGGKGKSFYLN